MADFARRRTAPSSIRVACTLLLIACAAWTLGASCGPFAPDVARLESRSLAFVETPGGVVDAAGGNLQITRQDLDIDTRMGNVAVGAVWNSATASWTWSFDMSFDGETFVDPTGASHDVSNVANGETVPGTHWVRLATGTIKTKGGKVFHFGPSGRISEVAWGGQSGVALWYTTTWIASQARVTRIDACRWSTLECTLVFSIGYDADGRVTSVLDRAAREAFFTYDAEGHLVQARDALDVAEGWAGWRYEYDGDLLVARTNSQDERVEYEYWKGRVSEVRQIGLGDPTWSFLYLGSTRGAQTIVTSPLGGRRTLRFDPSRRLESVTDEVGDTTSWTWAPNALRPSSMTTPSGATTIWKYANDDVVEETQSTGRVVHYSYDPAGIDRDRPLQRAVAAVTDDLGVLTSRNYNADGSLAAIWKTGEPTISFTYTSDDELASITGGSGAGVELSQYGDHGHPERVVADGVIDYRVYDGVGNLLEGADLTVPDGAGLGGVVSRSFDDDRNLSRVVLSDLDSTMSIATMTVTSTSTLEIDWRSDHRRSEIRRPFGGDSQFQHDALGRLAVRRDRVDGAWNETIFEYDAAGNRTATERPNGMRTEHSYDLAGHWVGVAHYRDAELESSVTADWSGGRLMTLFDSVHGAPEVRSRDEHGRIASITYPGGETLQLGYDVRSRIVSSDFVMPDASVLRSIEYAFDGADRVVAVRDGGVPIVADTYWDGSLIQRDYGNGLTRSFSYDPETGDLDGTTTANAQGAAFETTTITRGDCTHAGVTSECMTSDTSTFVGAIATSHERYQFSNTLFEGPGGQRVGRWTDPSSAGAEAYYSYDELSNLSAVGDASGIDDLVYNAERNRVLSVQRGGATIADYAYDEAGFVTARAGEDVTWTASGRVSGIGTSQFAWDSLGRPTSRVTPTENVVLLFGGRVEADPAGTPQSLDLGVVKLSLADGSRLYRHYDFRNNVKFVTDDAGSVVAHYQYSAFGLDSVFGAGVDTRRFAQGRDLGEVVRLGARVYDPLIGRFLSQDPFYQLLDQYTYTHGNPVAFWDPAGTWYVHIRLKLNPFNPEIEFDAGTGEDPRHQSQPPPTCTPPSEPPPPALPPGGDGGGAGDGSDGGGEGGGIPDGGGGVPGGTGGGCGQAPTRIPHASALLAALLPLQLALGVRVLHRRCQARSRRIDGAKDAERHASRAV